MNEITLYHYLVLALFLFVIGLVGSICSKHVIKVLISIEFMLTAVNINLIAFSAFSGEGNVDGCILALFYTGLGAVELAVALYIFYLMYNKKQSENIEHYGEL